MVTNKTIAMPVFAHSMATTVLDTNRVGCVISICKNQTQSECYTYVLSGPPPERSSHSWKLLLRALVLQDEAFTYYIRTCTKYFCAHSCMQEVTILGVTESLPSKRAAKQTDGREESLKPSQQRRPAQCSVRELVVWRELTHASSSWGKFSCPSSGLVLNSWQFI
jgi:hypothetical protein